MDNDVYTETSSQGWLSRIGESIKGILFGLILFIVAFPLLWWNEGRSVERYKTLNEGQEVVVEVDVASPVPANNNKLVHTQGKAQTDEILHDDLFNIAGNAINLQRNVQMYQWQENVQTETKEELGGSKTTTKTYTYSKNWNDNKINSSHFKRPGHDNPEMLVNSRTQLAQQVTLGGFRLNKSQISRIGGATALGLDEFDIPAEVSGRAVANIDNTLYVGENPSSPEIGDLKINFMVIKDSDVSLVAQQKDDSFEVYQTQAGGTIDLFESRLMDANAMFVAAHRENTYITWGLRLGGFIVMWLGIFFIFRPLAVLGSVVPFLGNFIAMGTGLVAFFISFPLSLITIALAWFAYRPMLAGGLLVCALIVLYATRFVPRADRVQVQPG